ncbi:adenosine deaminase-like growth [Amylostereum chailletii]|nr:adenosine deaminase-like growth [Amylostereum chailletii]
MANVQLSEYMARRSALIQEDRSLRRENALLTTLTDAEKRADGIVRKIREDEANTVWKDENIPNVFPGMGFLTCKDVIDKTQVFKLIQKMPKGALLHAHLDATVHKTILMKLAYEHPEIHISAPEGVTLTNLSSNVPLLQVFSQPQFTGTASVSANTGYQAGSWIPLSVARVSFDTALGGPEGFDKWLYGTMTINPSEAYGTHNTVKKIWEKFLSTFRATTGLFYYRPIYRKYIRQFLIESIDDGISYMEPRINFINKFMWGESGEQNVPHREWLLDFDEIVKEVKAEMKNQGREDDFIGAKVIYTTVRVITPEEMTWYTEDVIALKQEFPHLIAGFDIVGDENIAHPLTDYLPQLLVFNEKVRSQGLDLPLILHAGETLSDGGEPDNNMYDAILLGTKRIGHGYSIVKHPKLMQICRDQQIALEICPISNEILRLTPSIPAHPLPIVINQGIPVALNSDDPAVFGAMGLSYDFYQVLVSSEISGIITLAQMARDSLSFSTLSESEKGLALASWERRWSKFVDEVGSLDVSE